MSPATLRPAVKNDPFSWFPNLGRPSGLSQGRLAVITSYNHYLVSKILPPVLIPLAA